MSSASIDGKERRRTRRFPPEPMNVVGVPDRPLLALLGSPHLDRDVGADLERADLDLQGRRERLRTAGCALGRPLEDATQVAAQGVTDGRVRMT